ncbi:regulatory subunit for Cdc7p protein kinase [Blastomyces gilchristii SLH14081]|uniref:Regulatory subunit for Cdc7p protein kinase n=2 Tax=Blastomyces TaxID=229219 RepID=A0A179UEZ6_BLAGS|nr:regulatory subunit for Cdc7p protein kinase [Blastomyces gilchristii SLH14081]OAT05839.1 regulatory subunit for Cdc7p protein kinase [Blastomyces gilchristii SLH14081]
MSSRRVPLVNIPNGTNSPHRGAITSGKRNLPGNYQTEMLFMQPPPKKQMLEKNEGDLNNKSPRKLAVTSTEGKVFTRKNTNSQPTAFERKLVAAREKDRAHNSRGTRYDRTGGETLDSIRQWQKHYRKAFPQFVFYFESIPEDVRNKCSRQIMALGATEEKFFSKVVTHVVTARPIPRGMDSPNHTEISTNAPLGQQNADGSVQTVDPSLLEKNYESSHVSQGVGRPRKISDKRPGQEGDTRRDNKDVLYRARQMNMKIWALEKLQRVISTMNDGENIAHHGHYTRSNGTVSGAGRGRAETDLSQVLRNERLHGPTDRDSILASKEIIPFKGPFIYIHDYEEKTRPVMVREYPKVARRQDGAWPQFRSAALGKCPFIDEPLTKKELEKRKATANQTKDKWPATKEKSTATTEIKTMQPPERSVEKRALQDAQEGVNQTITREAPVPAPKRVETLLMLPAKPASPRTKGFETFPDAKASLATYLAREPAASGVQPSNITSAIRSQMVSSTAAAPGAKAGTSKEVHGLKRKVLEKGHSTLSANGSGIPSSHRMTDISGALKASRAPVTRAAKSKATGNLDQIDEDGTTQSEGEKVQKPQQASRKSNTARSRQKKRDPKPGYCENCRDKFEDFEEPNNTNHCRPFVEFGPTELGKESSLVRHTKKCVDGRPPVVRQKACRECSAAKTRCDLKRPTCSRCTLRNTICMYPTYPAGPEIGVESHGFPQKDSQKSTSPLQGHVRFGPDPLCGGFNPEVELPTPESETLDFHSILPPDLGVLENELSAVFDGYTDVDSLNYNYALVRNIPDSSSGEGVQIAPSTPPPAYALGLTRHTMQTLFRIAQTWPRMMAKGTQLPPIIHPKQVSDGIIPEPLTNCFALVKMWHGQPHGGASIVQQTVRREMQTIANSFQTLDETELVAALQALTIYTLMLLFPSNDQQTIPLLEDKLVRQLRSIIQHVVSTGVVLQEEIERTRPFWECWIAVTCKRRAALSLYTIYWGYSVYHCIPAFDCSELHHMPAPAPKYLWQATTNEQWESLYNRWLAHWDGPYYRHGEIFEINTGIRMDPRAELWFEEVDEFGMIFAAAINALEREPELTVMETAA